MFRSFKLRLSLSTVLPLLDLIQERAASINAAGRTPEDREDLHILLELLRPEFSHTDGIRVDGEAIPAVLRACSLLRIEFRQKNLSAIPDAILESEESLDPKLYEGKEQETVMCYLLLAVIQEASLAHFAPHPSDFSSLVQTFRDGFIRIGNRFRPRRAASIQASRSLATPAVARSARTGEVVVLNDPINLMSYVTAVFQIVLGLPAEMAREHMREVHEVKSSKVWSGPLEKAEAHLLTLRSWHLNAVLRSGEAASTNPIAAGQKGNTDLG